MSAAPTAYSRLQITLHWVIAALVVIAYFSSDGMGDALEARLQSGTLGVTPHTAAGSLVFVLALVRLFVRRRHGAPAPASDNAMLAAAATWGHRLLYLLMLAVPLGGMIVWVGGIAALGDTHELAGKAFLLVAFGHAVAAILHEVLAGDGTLNRMFSSRD